MDAAINILAEASGVRTKPPSSPVPPPSPVTDLDRRTVGSTDDQNQLIFLQELSLKSPTMSAVAVLQDAARVTHSRALERLAVQIQAHASGPFDQLINMIEKMIFRLMDEQKQEDEHKLWCDHELKKTKEMKIDKDTKIKDLKADIQTEKAKVMVLTNRIKDTQEMIADIVEFKAKATEIRTAGKKENMLAIKDSEKAQKALENAIAVLNDFYKSSGEIPKEPWEFIQTPKDAYGTKNGLPENPDTWGNEAFKGTENANGRIIQILEGVMTKFVQMKVQTETQETDDQKDYEISMKDHTIEQTEREKEAQMLTIEMKRRDDNIALLESRVQGTSEELESTQQYLKDLVPACGAIDTSNRTDDTDYSGSYQNRKDARSKEIAALKKAQGILTDAFKETTTGRPSLFLEVKPHAVSA
jgi:hypothetical protein